MWQLLTWRNIIIFYNIRFSYTPKLLHCDGQESLEFEFNGMTNLGSVTMENAILEAFRYIMALHIMQRFKPCFVYLPYMVILGDHYCHGEILRPQFQKLVVEEPWKF